MSADGTSVAAVGRALCATRIVEAWGAMLDSVIETGRRLIVAKDQLPHGEFEAMIASSELPFGASTARMLMKIASNPQLTKREYVHVLPPSWGTLYELTKLPAERLEAAISSGQVTPDMERKDAVILRTGDRRVERLATAERLSRTAPQKLEDLAAKRRYPVVYADPPWRFETWSAKGQEKSPENHYPTMTRDEIASLPIPSLAAEDAALFLWVTDLDHAISLIRTWGFTYKSHVVWRKLNPNGSPHRGTGYWFINRHELLLLATRGDIPAPVMGTQADSIIDAAIGRHSEKPECFYELIEQYFPDVGRIELFARKRRKGWDCWGSEVPA
jgi:N6-adenosine-specific RNA methylase IME4